MNYAQLVQAVQDYTENDEATFVSQIPRFVQQTEERLARAVMIPNLRRNQTGNMTASNRFLSTPSDFLAVFSLAVLNGDGEYEFLLNKDVNFIREAYNETTTEGIPQYYALFSNASFILGPTPDQSYNVQLHYYYQPESIVTAGTSWYGDNAESALLYGVLIEAYTFMKGEQDLINLYAKRYEEALQQLYVLGEGRNRRDSYRNGEPRVPVT
jgi:hypothetical protein